ncbi:hypothetical protein [Flavivirga jejuensis]|uniref:Uncharacterized protein n=1 Tax=Flavivirga jejuensis TaxID=870487 RepID=A0ABT8WQR4_9FLAO|nr:hypothetical protein [Flavivirga jejuensis]MDO5975496.1 hypothetical protein [Flavivirga jejuensis]
MIDRPITHLVINEIGIEEEEILVGATDNERWRWDMEDEVETGANSKTIVYVTLTDNGKGYAVSENAGFHASPGDPTREVAMSNLVELFEIAWSIKNDNLDYKDAREKYFGKKIKKTTNTM